MLFLPIFLAMALPRFLRRFTRAMLFVTVAVVLIIGVAVLKFYAADDMWTPGPGFKTIEFGKGDFAIRAVKIPAAKYVWVYVDVFGYVAGVEKDDTGLRPKFEKVP